MTYEEKNEMLDNLYMKLDNVNTMLNKHKANTMLRIQSRKIRKEIKELKMIMCDEDFEQLLRERSEICIERC